MVVAHRAEREEIREPVGLAAGERERLRDEGADARGEVLALALAGDGRRERERGAHAERRLRLRVRALVDGVPVAAADNDVAQERLVRGGGGGVGAVGDLDVDLAVEVDVGFVERLVDEVVPQVEREALVVGGGGAEVALADTDRAGRHHVPPREAGEVEPALRLLLLDRRGGRGGVGTRRGAPRHGGHGRARCGRRRGQPGRRDAEVDGRRGGRRGRARSRRRRGLRVGYREAARQAQGGQRHRSQRLLHDRVSRSAGARKCPGPLLTATHPRQREGPGAGARQAEIVPGARDLPNRANHGGNGARGRGASPA